MNMSMRLYRRPNGIFYVEFRRGKAKSLATRDQSEAKSIFREMEKEWLKGRLFHLETAKRTSLSDFTKIYLNSRAGISPKTFKQDKLSLSLLADAIGGNTPLRLIDKAKIDEFKRVCLARGAKPQSVNSYLRHIKKALNEGYDLELIKKKPKIVMLPVNTELPCVLTPSEIKVLLAKAKEEDIELWRILVFLLWTGCRRTEAIKLHWSDCCLDIDTPYCVLRKTKGKRDRKVPLLPPALDVLVPSRKDLVPVSRQLHPDTLTHKFENLARNCGIKARLHDLRHTAATYMLTSGIDIRTVQGDLGPCSLFHYCNIYARDKG